MTPITLGDTYRVVLDNNIGYDLVFNKNEYGDFYTVTISIDDTVILYRKVASGEDIFAETAVNRVYAENADLIETNQTRFILE